VGPKPPCATKLDAHRQIISAIGNRISRPRVTSIRCRVKLACCAVPCTVLSGRPRPFGRFSLQDTAHGPSRINELQKCFRFNGACHYVTNAFIVGVIRLACLLPIARGASGVAPGSFGVFFYFVSLPPFPPPPPGVWLVLFSGALSGPVAEI